MSKALVLCVLLGLGVATVGCGEQARPPADAGAMAPGRDGGGAPTAEFPEQKGATAVLEDVNPDPNVVEVHLTAAVQERTVGGETLPMYTYNGQFPGPLLQAKVGDEVIVHFHNALPEPTTVHWHGLRIPDAMDGSPRLQTPVPPGGEFTYRFVVPDAGTFWYHPHVRANEQVEKGLQGPIVIRRAEDPTYDAERVLMLDDIAVAAGTGRFPRFLGDHMEEMHGRHGDVRLTNGVELENLEPATARQGTVERWRIFNTANATTLRLGITGAVFRVIGTDGGPLRSPYTAERLTVPVGQRYDVEVSYDQPGRVELRAERLMEGHGAAEPEEPLAAFVVEVEETGESPRAIAWPAQPEPAVRAETQTITLRFDAVQDAQGHLVWRINGVAHPTEPLFTFPHGATVRMKLQNLLAPEHPFHLHGQFFEILSGGRPSTTEPGLKDTVLVPGSRTVEIRAYLDNPGRWMAHCHILEHAELGMMSELVVLPHGQQPHDGGTVDGGTAAPTDGGTTPAADGGGHHGH